MVYWFGFLLLNLLFCVLWYWLSMQKIVCYISLQRLVVYYLLVLSIVIIIVQTSVSLRITMGSEVLKYAGLLFLIVYGNLIWRRGGRKSKVKNVIFILILCSIVEILVCNYRHFESLFLKPYDIIKEKGVLNWNKESDEIIIPFNNSWSVLETKELSGKASNLYIDCEYLNGSGGTLDILPIEITVSARDEGNNLYMDLPVRELIPGIERSKYLKLNLTGDLRSLRLAFNNDTNSEAQSVRFNQIVLNKTVPLHISLLRWLIFVLLGLFFAAIRPTSSLYSVKFEDNFRGKKLLTGLNVIIICLMFVGVTFMNPQYNLENYKTQYHELAEAMSNGNLYLDEEPAPSLLKMDNPYDEIYRHTIVEVKAGEQYRLDHALYNGKYYVYFGAVPVLMIFLPVFLLTGVHVSIPLAISIFAVPWILGVYVLLWNLFKKTFSRAPFISYLLSCLFLLICSGMFYAFRGPQFYALPILAAAAFAIWGLNFWLDSVEIDGEINNVKVVLGSLCVALTAGCRPQFLIIAFSSIIIFWKTVVHSQSKRSLRRKIGFWLSYILPFIVVAIVVSYYNFVRFGSPFDFGVNYNLTTSDFTHRGWHWDRLGLGLFYYLFDPTKLSPVFPFILDSLMPSNSFINYTNYLGETIVEGNFGGFLFNHPILFLPAFIGYFKKYFKNKDLYRLVIFFLLSALILVVFDTEMSGIVGRYIMDFGWLMCLGTIICLNIIYMNCSNISTTLILRGVFGFSLIWGILYEFFLIFNNNTNSLIKLFNPWLYYQVQILIEFWL